ncbi:MAG: hypothetical protein ACLPIC_05325 [Rhodoblastus sp.]|uniref:hypothetical protein n=1 Tax=Rhodoblastus sp. TaxID=1962975 RepID=UPI003F974EF7
MTHPYVIQIAGRIVARDHAGQAFHFFASNSLFRPLEGVAISRTASRRTRRPADPQQGCFHSAPQAATDAVELGARRNPPSGHGF